MQSDKGEKKEARNFLRLSTKFPFQIREKAPFVEEVAHGEDYTDFLVNFPPLFLHTTLLNMVFVSNSQNPGRQK